MPAPITNEDLYLFRWVDHVRFSPAGDRIAYQVAWADAESRQNRSRVYVRGIGAADQPVEATAGPKRDHDARWSPDGGRLAFLSRRGGRDQVYVLDMRGGDARQLTSAPEGVSMPTWAPDSGRVAFLATVIADPEGVVDDSRPPEGEDEARRPPVARVVRRLDYKHDGAGYVDGRAAHLFVIPAEGGEPEEITNGPWGVGAYAWSPDSARFLVTGNADPDSDLSRHVHLYVVEADRTLRKLVSGMTVSVPAWSPRGDMVAFVAPDGDQAGLCERLWVVPAAGGEPRCLTAGLDASVGGAVISDMRAGHGSRICWDQAGERVYFLAGGPGRAGLHSVGVDGGGVRQELGGERSIYDFDLDRSTGAVVLCSSDATTPGDVRIATRGPGSSQYDETRLTRLNGWLEERYLAVPERMEFVAGDGLKIEGWLLKPPGFDPARKHPLVMQVHGGPNGQYGWAFFHEFQCLAGAGMLVFYTNPRGSDGYGEAFKHAVVRDWGGRDYQDLMTSLDQLVERTGFVDTSRMGIAGGSYGGYMTNWIIGHTDRFAAAVTMRSISNLVSEYAQHDIVIWGEQQLGPPPWDNLDELWERSPIRYIKDMKTPLLIIHGEMDLRCAISQAEELFGSLRLLGREVEMVRFPGESHDLSRAGRPDRRVERLRRIQGWFERHLLAESAPAAGQAATAAAVE